MFLLGLIIYALSSLDCTLKMILVFAETPAMVWKAETSFRELNGRYWLKVTYQTLRKCFIGISKHREENRKLFFLREVIQTSFTVIFSVLT